MEFTPRLILSPRLQAHLHISLTTDRSTTLKPCTPLQLLLHHGKHQLANHQHRRPRPRIIYQLRPFHSHTWRPARLNFRCSVSLGSNKAITTRRRPRRGTDRSAGECAIRSRCARKGASLPYIYIYSVITDRRRPFSLFQKQQAEEVEPRTMLTNS